MKEIDLAAAVVRWLEEESWTVYQEVEYEGRIADIVATRGESESWIVECKAKRDGRVLQQAKRWKHEASYISIAVPAAVRAVPAGWDIHNFANGIGEFVVGKDYVSIRRAPNRHRVRDHLGIRSVLKEEHKSYAKAGNADGKRLTPFAIVRDNLTHLVTQYPGSHIRAFVESIEHHWANDEVAEKTLRKVIKSGGVPGIEIRHGGRCYPEGYDRHSVRKSE